MPSTRRTRADHAETATDAIPLSGRPKPVPHVRLIFDRVRERHVLLGPEAVFVLNPTGATILGLCDGRRTFTEILTELRGRYDHVADDEVARFLVRLVTRGFVEVDND